ncbi:MAG: DUF1501 domain-containing protein [Verrucomicrobiota bacterium]
MNPFLQRRQFLGAAALGFGQVAFQSLLASESQPRPHFPARAKRVIFLFMKGGPSHIDTFDPKPLLDRDHGKPPPFELPRVTFAKQGNLLKSPWQFRRYGESGLPVSDLFPQVAQCVDDLCILRGVHGTNPAHGGAVLKLHTGSDTFVRPSMGSWIVYGLGSENHNLPSFITICPTLAHGGVNNWGSAFLPQYCQGTPMGTASSSSLEAQVKHITTPSSVATDQRKQLDFLRKLNESSVAANPEVEGLNARLESFELAYRMQTSMPEAQDLAGETEVTKKLYGLDDPVTEDFGRQCLLARRFCERGVRFIQVTHSDSEVQWDQHSNLYQGHTKNAAEVDKPIAGLLKDLKSRGMLEDTLVIWGGEFGRTPTAQGGNGRDHNPHGFTVWMAGGGVKGGMAYGATDDYGYYAERDKMHVHDLHATILHLMGINHEALTFRHAGRDFRLTDVHGTVAESILA